MAVRHTLLALAALILVVTACHKSEVTYYRVPKEKDRALPGMAGPPVMAAEGAGLTWTAPATWKPKPAAAVRKGSYAVPGAGEAEADLSITAFPGDVGGEVANVNRWRGQLRLPALREGEMNSAITRVERNGLKFTLVDFAGTGPAGPQRIVGAMVPFAGATWFFKLTGADAPVLQTKPAFEAFLATVQPPAPP